MSDPTWKRFTTAGYEEWRLCREQRDFYLYRENEAYAFSYRWHIRTTGGEIVWVGPQRYAIRRPPFRQAERQIARWERDNADDGGAA